MPQKYPQIKAVFDRRKVASLTRKGSLEIRVLYDYQQKYISTGILLCSNQWSEGQIINCSDAIQISEILNRLLTNIRTVILEMMQKGHIDIHAIPKELKKRDTAPITLYEFCVQRAEIRKYGKSKDSQRRYDRFLRLFNQWGKIQSFEDINERNIILYDRYLTKQGMKPYSKWNNYHRFLNSFILDAIDAGLLNRNPYKWVIIEREKDSNGLDKCLTPLEFRKIKTARMSTECLARVRDVFVFQTYTCLRYSDLARFDASLIKEIKGMKVYISNSRKTKKKFTVPILPTAWDILMKYDGQLPIISNVNYNKYLKDVAKEVGIEAPLTTHWARHTGATLLLNEGVDMNIITKICGHSSIRMTEKIYAKLLDETVVDSIQEIGDKLE